MNGVSGPVSLPRRRVILLGASNIARGFATIVSTCRHLYPEPLDILTAGGHGRGYGLESWVLGRTLPPILECGLWDALAARRSLDTVTLLTDIGNDLVFGASCEQVADWVEQCLQRLARLSQRVIMTELPLVSVSKLGVFRFRLFRTLLFPRSLLTHGVALTEVHRLNERVVELANRFGAHLVRPEEHWYGFDPIHVRRTRQNSAWQKILSAGITEQSPGGGTSTFSLFRALCCLRPHQRHLFGIEQTCQQPCAELSDGTLISLY